MNAITHPLSAEKAESFTWPTVGKPGWVPLDSLAPSPLQPRMFFDEGELDALAETMKGGGQREIITVRELNPAERESRAYPESVRYVIVSGERRWRGARKAGLPAIEIRVREYSSEADEAEDAYMLNEGRVNLTDIENAHGLAKLAQLKGWKTQEEIGKQTGKNPVLVSDLFALLRLSPKVQARFDPSLPRRDRFTREVGLLLAKAEHAKQDELIETMPKTLVTAVQRIGWLTREMNDRGVELPTRRREPRRMRELIGGLAEYLDPRVESYSAETDFDRIFENATPEVRHAFTRRMKASLAAYQELVERIERLSQGVRVVGKAPSAPITHTPAPFDAKAAAARFAESVRSPAKPASSVARPAPVAPAVTRVHPMRILPESVAEKPTTNSVPKKQSSKSLAVNCYDETTGRLVMKVLNLAEYVAMYDKGYLDFQQKQRPKPDHLPSREEALRLSRA